MNSIIPKRAARPGRRRVPGVLRALVLGLGLLLLIGCTQAPIAPRARLAYVPYPWEVDSTYSMERIHEMYSLSPNRNPEGLGTLDTMWPQSYMTLVIWEYQRQVEEKNKIAYARTVTEQTIALEESEAFFESHLVFTGVLASEFEELIDLESYGAEGIYIINDQNEKFVPVTVKNIDPFHSELIYKIDATIRYHFAAPRLVFPAGAINETTRWVRLFIAHFQRRMSFTWVFDPDYSPADYRGRDIRGRRAAWYTE